ncbi:MAG TPA: hypothetical protein VI953_00145 [Candidatus Paceibacterota bacterium]
MNDEFLSKLTQAARQVKLDPSEKARIGAKLGEFVKANPIPNVIAPASAEPFSGSQFFGQHFGMLAVASFLIVVGAGIVSVTSDNPGVFSPVLTPASDKANQLPYSSTPNSPRDTSTVSPASKVEPVNPPAESSQALTPTSTIGATTTTDSPKATTTTRSPSSNLLP